MNGLSLYSTCLELSYGGLYFTNLAHRFYIPMSKEAMCTTSSRFGETFGSEENFGLIIHSSLFPETLRELTFGQQRFDLLRSESDVVASFGFYKTIDKKVFLLHRVRINVLGGSLLSPVVVEDNMLTFGGVYNLFSVSVYKASVIGQADISSTDSWDSLNIVLSGWFSAETGLISLIEDAVHNYIVLEAAEAERRKNESESMLFAITTRLNLTMIELNRAKEEYNETLGIYRTALDRRTEAENNLSAARDTVLNATDEIQNAERAVDDLCAVKNCPLECVPTTLSRTIYEDIFVNVTGTCNSICYDISRQRIPPYEEVQIRWRFTEECRPNIVVCGTGTCNEMICSFLCLSFREIKPVFNYDDLTIARQCMTPCIVQELNRTVEKQEAYTSPCGKMIPDQLCAASNKACQEQRNQAFGLIDKKEEGLTEPLRLRNAAQAAYSNAINEVIKTEIKNDRAELNLEAAQLKHEVVLRLKTVSEKNNAIITESVQNGLAFSRLLLNFTIDDIVAIHNITFNVSDSQEPTEFPLSIMFSTPYKSEMFSVIVSYNFESSFNTQVDSIAIEIAEMIIHSIGATGKKRSLYRARRTEPVVSDYGQEQFEIRCSQLTSVYRFVQHLRESLLSSNNSKQDLFLSIMDSVHQLNETKINNVSEIFTVNYTSLMMLFNITQEDIDLQNTQNTNYSVGSTDLSVQSLIDDLISNSLETLSTIDVDLFQQWQLDLETLVEDSSIAEINCYGLIDCVVVLERVVEDLIYFGHNTSLVSSLQFAISRLKVVVSDSGLTIDYALDNIIPILDVVKNMVDNGYWCAKPPEIIMHPVPEVNVSVDGTLYLNCVGQSTLPLRYRWTKNGIQIPDATTNRYVLSNIEVSDQGNYTCEMTNDVSTIRTIDANVLVYELPIFYLTPVPVTTYVGASSGAWFACNATSRPDPGWRWYHRAASEDPWEVIGGEETNELLIEQPTRSEEGFYMCSAYNYHGNITSDPVSLRLLEVSVRSSSYPAQFTLQASNAMRKRQSVADTDLMTQLSTFINTSSIVITNVRTEYSSNKTVLTVLFDLTPAEALLATQPFQEIVSDVFELQGDLEVAKEQLERYFGANDISVILNFDEQAFIADKSSLTFKIFNILCPSGQELYTNYILCSK